MFFTDFQTVVFTSCFGMLVACIGNAIVFSKRATRGRWYARPGSAPTACVRPPAVIVRPSQFRDLDRSASQDSLTLSMLRNARHTRYAAVARGSH